MKYEMLQAYYSKPDYQKYNESDMFMKYGTKGGYVECLQQGALILSYFQKVRNADMA